MRFGSWARLPVGQCTVQFRGVGVWEGSKGTSRATEPYCCCLHVTFIVWTVDWILAIDTSSNRGTASNAALSFKLPSGINCMAMWVHRKGARTYNVHSYVGTYIVTFTLSFHGNGVGWKFEMQQSKLALNYVTSYSELHKYVYLYASMCIPSYV